jgi:SAM-dependent methyltransferase
MPEEPAFGQNYASIFDAVHTRGTDFAGRAALIDSICRTYKRAPGNTLLDVACGTGRLVEQLWPRYLADGLDASQHMLRLAATRVPAAKFHHGNMQDFSLNERFDVITCVGSSLCYLRDLDALAATIATMARHLNPGGIIIADHWLQPDQYHALETQGVWRVDVDEADRKISMLRRHERTGVHVVLEAHYMVGTATEVTYFSGRHPLTMFDDGEKREAFERNGLSPTFIPDPNLYFGGAWLYVAAEPAPERS